MVKTAWTYVSGCFIRALRGSLSSALNWAGILGVGAVGAYFEYRGRQMSDPHDWHEVVKWGFIYTGVAWAIIFVIRAVFVAPFQMFAAATEQANPARLREIEVQEAHTRAIERQAKALEKQNRENDPFVKMIRAKQERDLLPRVLKLSVGTDHEYYDVPKSGVWGFTRRFKVRLQNVSQHKSITNGKVQILSIEPPTSYRSPWLLKDGITIPPGDHTFLPLASYNELRDLDKGMTPEDTFKIESLPGDHRQPLLGTENQPHVLTLRATASDVPFCDMRCKLWVDDQGRFQIEEI
jgi:hypothetical protein